MKTLKSIIAVVLLLFAVNTAKAQDTTIIISPDERIMEDKAPSQVGFHLGVRMQPTFSAFDIRTENDEIISDFTAGIGYGASINYYISNYVGLHLEGMYSSLTQKFRDSVGADTRVTLNYLNFPLLLSLNTNYGRAVNLNIAAGPQVGISTGARVDTEPANGGTATGQATVRVKPMDIGVAYGAGIDFGIGEEKNVHLNIGYRGVYGLVDVSDGKVDVGTGDAYVLPKSKVRSHGVYLGFMFKL